MPAATVRSAFAAGFGPHLRRLGFRPLRDELWVTDHAAPMRHAVVLLPGRADHRLRWGLRFDFAPFITDGGELRQHTDKDPACFGLDLIHDPYADVRHDPRNPWRHGVTASFGPRILERHLRRERRRLLPRIRRFVRSTRTLADALAAYRQAESLSDFGQWVPHWTSYPYVLAANGHPDEARRRMDEWFQRIPEHAAHRVRLGRLLAACQPTA